MLHDVGKIAVDLYVEYDDGVRWHPWHGPLTRPYRFLAPALIWNTNERPAPFGGTVHIEDSSGAQIRAPTPTPAPASSSLNATRTALANAELSASQVQSNDAVDSVLALLADADSDVSESDDAPTEPAVAAASLRIQDRPAAKETFPSSPPNTLEDPPGAQFMAWLRNGIQMHRLVINDAKALVHLVAGTACLVSPGVFQRYVQEHPQVAHRARPEMLSDWQWVQKTFERLRLHRKRDNGLNIRTCEVTGPRRTRRLHGYLLKDVSVLFAEVPFDNPYLKLLTGKKPPETEAA